jgi:hypothetical protein
MFDDFAAYVYKTSDFGKTWTRVGKGLPEKGYVHIVREDPRNHGGLCGTEVGLYISRDSEGDLPARLRARAFPRCRCTTYSFIRATTISSSGLTAAGSIFDDATPIQVLGSSKALRCAPGDAVHDDADPLRHRRRARSADPTRPTGAHYLPSQGSRGRRCAPKVEFSTEAVPFSGL